MIIVEIYGFEDKQRTHYCREFKDLDSWERDYMMRKLANTWVGHKIYHDMTMREWAQMTPEQRMMQSPEQLFDKEAYLDHKRKSGITMAEAVKSHDYLSAAPFDIINTNTDKE